MTATSFDPFRSERALLWRNRIARWREDAGQTVLHGVALLGLAALLLPLLRQSARALAQPMLDALLRWPGPVAVMLLGLFAWRQARRRQALERTETREWWAAQPIAAQIRSARRREWQAVEAGFQFATGALALAIAGAPPLAYAMLLLLVLFAIVLSPLLARRIAWRESRRAQLGSRLGDAGRGRLWRWQRIETGVALRGRALGYGVWALLLVPMGSGPGVVLIVLGAGLVLAMLATTWTRSLAVLPEAHAWLQSQPVAGRRWLGAGVVVPATVLGVATLLVASVLYSLGTPALALAAMFAMAAFGALQFACSFALRGEPRRSALHLALHLTVLVSVVQAAAPLALPVWLMQMCWLLRRGVRA
jgi:hypothetical protein